MGVRQIAFVRGQALFDVYSTVMYAVQKSEHFYNGKDSTWMLRNVNCLVQFRVELFVCFYSVGQIIGQNVDGG